MKLENWVLEFDDFVPERVAHREALCTLGNGYFATRGAGEEADADDINYPGTYFAGGYNRLETEIAGRTLENEDLVNFPNWLPLTFRAGDGDWLNLKAVKILDYCLALDLREAVLSRKLRFEDRHGRRTRIDSRRIVHMRQPHLAAIMQTITAENWSGPAMIRSAVDGRIINAGVSRYRQLNCTHLEPIAEQGGGGSPIALTVRTSQSGVVVSVAACTKIWRGAQEFACERDTSRESGYIGEEFIIGLEQGQSISLEKTVALFTSRDAAISEPRTAALQALQECPRYLELETSHSQEWQRLWRRADITLKDGQRRATSLLRFHSFQLLQTLTYNSIDLDVGVPARGLHGEAYRGHVFWDELFVLPFYNAHFPQLARSLLKYRYRRLDMARRLAREAGFRGAMFPWQSGSSGREESQLLHLNPKSGRWIEDHTYLQRHATAAVAYNVWSYYQATGDLRYMIEFGAEILLETARFWASIAEWNPDRSRYEIRFVVGPDEYHTAYVGEDRPGIHNNAYTNLMAAWCLDTAHKCLDCLPSDARAEISEELGIAGEECDSWRDISTKMFVPFHDGDIISQFEGYETLEEIDWDGYRRKYGDIQRLDRLLEAEGDTPNRYKLSKQADVLMLFYLFSAEELTDLMQRLGYAFDSQSIPKIIDYYLKRTAHGSSLSRVVHSWVLARSDRNASWHLFLDALEKDISDTQHGTTAEGIHLGAMAATVDILERCYTGRELQAGRLRLNPRLPVDLQTLCFNIAYWGNWLTVTIEQDRVRIKADRYTSEPIKLTIDDTEYEVPPGEAIDVPIERG